MPPEREKFRGRLGTKFMILVLHVTWGKYLVFYAAVLGIMSTLTIPRFPRCDPLEAGGGFMCGIKDG